MVNRRREDRLTPEEWKELLAEAARVQREREAEAAMAKRVTPGRLRALRAGEYSTHPDTTTRIIRDLLSELDAVTKERDELRQAIACGRSATED